MCVRDGSVLLVEQREYRGLPEEWNCPRYWAASLSVRPVPGLDFGVPDLEREDKDDDE